MKNKLCALKNSILNSKYNYSKNFYFHLIAPVVAILVGIVLLFTVGFNKGMDFAGGTNVRVVVENNLNDNEQYNNVKNKVSQILNENDVCPIVFQITETNYYGNAISVKFENKNLSEEQLQTLQAEIKQDLINEFYPELEDENDLNTFVKVESFGGSVSNKTIIRSILAVLVALVVAFIYIASRYGLSFGFISLAVALLDIICTYAWTLIFRVQIEQTILAVSVLVMTYSLVSTLLLFTRIKENLNKQKYEKSTNNQVANISINENMKRNIIAFVFLVLTLFIIAVMPFILVKRFVFPLIIGTIICFCSSIFITPGVWAFFHIRKQRKNKQIEKDNVVIEQPKEFEENIEDAPEVIVETEVKGDI